MQRFTVSMHVKKMLQQKIILHRNGGFNQYALRQDHFMAFATCQCFVYLVSQNCQESSKETFPIVTGPITNQCI